MASRNLRTHFYENEDYFNTQSLKDSIPRHDSYYSPSAASFKTPTKLTPKSILRESLTSGSKRKKNIQINEALNETRKISTKSGYNDYYLEKRPKIRDPKDRDQLGQRSNATIGGPLDGRYGTRSQSPSIRSLEQRTFEKKNYDIYTPFDSEKQSKETQYKATSFDTNVNMVDISREGLSEIQKAYVRKMQRERELELYSEMLSKPNSDLDRNDFMSRSNPEFYQSFQKKNDHEHRSNFLYSNEGKFTAPNLDSDETRSLANFPNLDHIEDKIYELEKNLDLYSKKLRASIERQKDHLMKDEYGNKCYEELGNSIKISKKKKLREDKTPLDSKKEDIIRGKASKNYSEYSRDQEKSNLSSSKKSSIIRQYRKPNETHTQQLEMKRELEHLKEENEKLKKKIQKGKNNKNPTNNQTSKQDIKNVLEKEKELLKVIDNIRNKLHKSIMRESSIEQKSYRESLRASSKNSERIERLAKPKKQYEVNKPKDVNSERVHMVREAYGAKKLERENASILNQGLSTSYSGFHWNADQTLKISKNLY